MKRGGWTKGKGSEGREEQMEGGCEEGERGRGGKKFQPCEVGGRRRETERKKEGERNRD